MTYLAWLVFFGAALLEVGGDAVIRKGLRGNNLVFVATGFVMPGCYGVVVNTVKWDFSKLLGVYVAVFALVSVLFGKFLFKEQIRFPRGSGSHAFASAPRLSNSETAVDRARKMISRLPSFVVQYPLL